MKTTTRVISDFSSIGEGNWERLDRADNPFLSRAFLGGLESSGSLGPHSGWRPHHLALYEGDELVAFAPSYLKANSHGEFVFDWAWADAFRQHQLPYYPKLLTAVPYSPITGPRLLTRQEHPDPETLRRGLVQLAVDECAQAGYSSWHCNFVSNEDQEVLQDCDLLARSDWQFHWRNKAYEDFDEFLAGLQSRKRKNIRKERRAVADAGIRFEWKDGNEIDEQEICFVHRCYTSTFHAYGNHPALNEQFFNGLARELGTRFQVSIASIDGAPVAMSLFLQGGGRLYGRYWGCMEDVPGLHFEAAYYQGIEYCIRNGLEVFESGAQGEHKIARGFMPTRTRSYHHVRHPAFRNAIADFLARESGWLDDYRDELLRHSPYRRDLP